MVKETAINKVENSVLNFVKWLDRYGELSFDHQSYFAGSIGGNAKALYYRHRIPGTLAVMPMIFSEAFVPSARRLFWKPQRFPIADAHYAMGFAYLAQVLNDEKFYRRAVHFLEVLEETRSPQCSRYGWGYPFDWVTRNGTIPRDTPFITTLPYVYEAFSAVYEIDHDPHWKAVMQSIAEHAFLDYRDYPLSPHSSTCAYSPDPEDHGGVVNASAYRAFLLTRAAADFKNEAYWSVAERNLNFVLEAQNQDGSWYYSVEGARDFVDHFHTCFVLKALAKIQAIRPSRECEATIERGVSYYTEHLFSDDLQPKPFAVRPRLTVYRHELYDMAECINLGTLLAGKSPKLDHIVGSLVTRSEWQKPDGSFRSRRLMLGWDNVPMHRWAQSQMFRSLCFWMLQESKANESSLDLQKVSA